jgi:periplasmic divalent cation tolerance protein
MTDKLLVLSTAGSQAEAARIAEELLERRLVACVNVIGRIQSFYRWEDKLQRAEEYLMLIKTVRAREEQVRAAIRELHSYELPEMISISIDDGSPEYLRWMDSCVEGASSGPAK